jgi:uncharacterized phage protein (TIGR02218 family)
VTRRWFGAELETVSTYWRVARPDGVTLGFSSHDRDLWFNGVLHQSAPGMVPSAIRRTTTTEPDSAEMQGALDHAAIRAVDLEVGRFEGAAVEVGLVDWETGESEPLFAGRIGTVSQGDGGFSAELLSAKAALGRELVPRTAPTCRAVFCGPGCTLSPARFTHELRVAAIDAPRGMVRFAGWADAGPLLWGSLRWTDGAEAGLSFAILDQDGGWIGFDRSLPPNLAPGDRAVALEGCDHTLDTCASRFGNAVNFQGEPFLPGNDLLVRYGNPAE